MEIRFNTEKKARAFISQIDHLLLSDFPLPASEPALKLIAEFFQTQLARLDRASASPDPKVLASACTTINQRIFSYLPILGFLLRSTNTRNNFEAYYAFVEMARSLIGPDANVIFSSEWDFSPLTYPMTVSVLPKYVLLGMPSSESSNSLILPLAGHELGHSVWINEKLENEFVANIQQKAIATIKSQWKSAFLQAFPEHSDITPTDDEFSNNMFLSFIISDIVKITLSQIEEIFCDAIGVHLFDASYALAFHYLLAPSIGGERSLEYPRTSDRALFMSSLGPLDLTKFGFSQFNSEFIDRVIKLTPRDGFVSQAADDIATSMAPAMYSRAKSIVQEKAKGYEPDVGAQAEIVRRFESGVPARNARCISDIVNAGWTFLHLKAPSFKEDDRSLID
jgi:hypothetical protein